MGSSTEITEEDTVLFFDGECKFCNGSVKFILRHERDDQIKFAPLQSVFADDILSKYGSSHKHLETIILISNGELFIKTRAVLKILDHLKYPWRLALVIKFIPDPIADYFYDIFAKYRYNLFGRQDTCMVPIPEVAKRFLD